MTGSGVRSPVPITDFYRAVGSREFQTAVQRFDCGVLELTTYLARFALQNHRNDSAKCYVATRERDIIGYYCLTSAAIGCEAAPERVVKGLARHDVPAVLLARLAVNRSDHGAGIGSSLLRDALLRTAQAAEIVACRILIVHAKNEKARRFYTTLGFRPLPNNPLHLYLLLKDVRRILRA